MDRLNVSNKIIVFGLYKQDVHAITHAHTHHTVLRSGHLHLSVPYCCLLAWRLWDCYWGFWGFFWEYEVTDGHAPRLELKAGKTVGERGSAAQTDSLGGSHRFAGISIHLCCLHGDTTQDKQRKGHFFFLSTDRNLHSIFFFLNSSLWCRSFILKLECVWNRDL